MRIIDDQFIKAHPPINEESNKLATLHINVSLFTVDALDETAMNYKAQIISKPEDESSTKIISLTSKY